MQYPVILKLILRSWWRNKLFASISLLSLAIGITCTILLISFVTYEYTIESSNPRKEDIFRLTQNVPVMQKQKQGTFVYGGSVPDIVSQFPEIESYLRMNELQTSGIRVGNEKFDKQTIVKADSSLLHFFPFETVYGNLPEVLSHPGQVAISEKLARLYFGNENYENRTITLELPDTIYTVQVTAIFRHYPQAMLQADILTSLPDPEQGSSCMILLKKEVQSASFRQRFEETGLPTLMGKGNYQLLGLQDSYFNTDLSDTSQTMEHREITLLSIGLLSALLILSIACFNYVNLSFSRLLKQVRMLHVETLMGATRQYIHKQLFADTFLTVMLAFLLSVLLINDLLPAFNSLVAAHLTFGFIFSGKVLPLLALFIIILSVIPALYMSRKMYSLSESNYRLFFIGKKKKRIVSILIILQFIISIALMTTFLIIRSQLNMIENEGKRYENIIELGDGQQLSLLPIYNDLKSLPGIKSAITTRGNIFEPWSMAVPVSQEGEEETLVMVNLYNESPKFQELYDMTLLHPERTKELIAQTAIPVIVNESFQHHFVPAGEDPISQPLNKYNKNNTQQGAIIVGVIKDFKLTSFNQPVAPLQMILQEVPENQCYYISLKIDPDQRIETLQKIRQLWETHFPHRSFTGTDLYMKYLSFNQEVTNFSQLLLVYSIISLFLTAFGLFGIAWYASEQRTREIGIRKVNGASTWQIVWLLNRPFLCYILIAFIIATPIVYTLMLHWIEQFAYRAPIGLKVFILPLLITLVMTICTVSFNSWRVAKSNPIDAIKE